MGGDPDIPGKLLFINLELSSSFLKVKVALVLRVMNKLLELIATFPD